MNQGQSQLIRFTDNERATLGRLGPTQCEDYTRVFAEHLSPRLLRHAPEQFLVTPIEFIDGKPYRAMTWVDGDGVQHSLCDNQSYLYLLYLTICTVNGKFYIGKMGRPLQRLNLFYVGSGKSIHGGDIKTAINKYG